MAKILKNQTASAINLDIGLTVPASGQLTLNSTEYSDAASSDDIVTHVGSGDIIINDGGADLTKSDGIDLIKEINPRQVDTSTEGLISVIDDAGIKRLAVDIKQTGASPNDFLSKVSNNDTTGDYLFNKIIVADETNTSNALEVKEINDGGDEDLKIAFDETKITITESQISDLGHTTDTNTFALIQIDGVSQSTTEPTLDFDSTDFQLTESPSDDFDITIKDSGIDHNQTTNYIANEHIDWTQSGAGTIHISNYTDNDTTDHTLLSNIGSNTHAQIDSHISNSAIHTDWSQPGAGTIHASNYVDNNTIYTHPNHTGEVTSIGDGAQIVDKTAITNKTTISGASGDFVLVSDTSDSGNLKKVDIGDLVGGGGSSNWQKTGTTLTPLVSGDAVRLGDLNPADSGLILQAIGDVEFKDANVYHRIMNDDTAQFSKATIELKNFNVAAGEAQDQRMFSLEKDTVGAAGGSHLLMRRQNNTGTEYLDYLNIDESNNIVFNYQKTAGRTYGGIRFQNADVEFAQQVKIEGGSPGTGKVLTSDATGLATWETPSGGIVGDMPSILITRSTTFAFPLTTPGSITFDNTVSEPNPTVLEHDNTNTDRIIFKEPGLYMVGYGLAVDRPNDSSANLQVNSEAILNGTTVLNHSRNDTTVFQDSSIPGSGHEDSLGATFPVYIQNANDYISIQGAYDTIGGTGGVSTDDEGLYFWAVKMQGQKGDAGGGGGSAIEVEDEGSTLTTGVTKFNFVGDGVTVTEPATDEVLVTIPGTNNAFSLWQIWAEESGALGSGLDEWSFGNGNTGDGIGIPVPVDCELFAGTFNTSTFGTSISIDIEVNGVNAQTVLFTSNGVENFTPVSISAGDTVGFKTNTVVGSFPNGRISACLRVNASGLPDTLYTPNGVAAITTEDITKKVKLEGYGTGAITGVEAFGIAVTSDGTIIERMIHNPDVSYVNISSTTFGSGTFVDIPGLSTTVTLQNTGTVAGDFTYSAIRAGGTNSVTNLRVVVNGDNGITFVDTVSSFNDIGTIAHHVDSLGAGTYTVKVQGNNNEDILFNAGVLHAIATED